MNKPTVSILMPCREAQGFLRDALVSLVAQTFEDFEVIVAPDDAAPGDGEDYSDIVRSVPDLAGRVRLLARQPEAGTGPARTRNRALAASHGQWIAALDADDALPPDYLHSLLHAAASHGVHAALAATEYHRMGDCVRTIAPRGALADIQDIARCMGSLRTLAHRSIETGWWGDFAEDVWRDANIVARLGRVPVANTIYLQSLHRASMSVTLGEDRVQRAYNRIIATCDSPPDDMPALCALDGDTRLQLAGIFRYRVMVSRLFARNNIAGHDYDSFVARKGDSFWEAFLASDSEIARVFG